MILNTSVAFAQVHPPGSIRDVEYAQVNGISLRLDACLPNSPVKTAAVGSEEIAGSMSNRSLNLYRKRALPGSRLTIA